MPSSGPRSGASEGMKLTGARASAVPWPGIGHESTSPGRLSSAAVSDRDATHVFPVRDESVVSDSVRNWRSERLARGRQDAARVGSGTRRSSVVDEYRGFPDHGPGVLFGDIRARPHRARRTGQRPVNDYSL